MPWNRWDTFDEPGYTPGDTKSITLTGLSSTAVTVTAVVPSADTGQEVTDYATAFAVATYPVSDGSVTIPVGEDPVLVEETTLDLPDSFVIVHADSTSVTDRRFTALADLMALADTYNVKLTIELTPQWAEMIAADPTKVNVVSNWLANGHEIGCHHHPL